MNIPAREIGNTKITCFRYITDKQGIECTLDDFLIKVNLACKDLINTLRSLEDDKEQRIFKTNNIPAATISMLCGEDKSAEHCKQKNNILVIDIDAHDNPQINNEIILQNTGYNLFNLPYVYAVGRSCRGKGLFVIIPILDANNIKQYFKSIEQEFNTNFNLVIDKQCSNINRLRFASYDEKLINKTWIKSNNIEIYDKILEDDTELLINTKKNVSDYNLINLGPNSLVMNDLFIIKALLLLIVKYKYTSDDYFSWLQDGFRLASLGDTFGFLWFLQISRRSKGYKNDDEVRRKFENCLKNTKMNRSCLSYYFGILKQHIGKNWIEEVNSVEIPENLYK